MTNIRSRPAHTDDEGEPKALVPEQKMSLGTRSCSLVARGLSDLAAPSNWHVRGCFSNNRSWLCVSRTGKVATHSMSDVAEVEIYDIEKAGECLTMRVKVGDGEFVSQDGAIDPTAQNVLVATATQAGEPHALLLLSLQTKTSLQIAPDADYRVPSWSVLGNYAVVSSSFRKASLRLWRVVDDTLQYVGALQLKSSSEYLLRCGSVAFDKKEQVVAVAAEVGSTAPNVLMHWDEIFLLNVPDLQIVRRIRPPDSVFGLSWSASQEHLVLTGTYGRTYSLDIKSGESTLLPFTAALCCCHPTEDICAFVGMEHELADDSDSERVKYKITIARLSDLSILSEYMFENTTEVLDACWSLDGDRFYAVSGSGQSYLYTVQGSP
jgi:hypothetical protein